MQRATDAIAKKLETRSRLQVGDLAPVVLANCVGKEIRLSDKLLQESVILTLYLGGWCPYCNLELRAYQQVLS